MIRASRTAVAVSRYPVTSMTFNARAEIPVICLLSKEIYCSAMVYLFELRCVIAHTTIVCLFLR